MGSVLSYDILCHQENLSSPFPMDWMYEEHARSEGFSGVDNQSSIHKSSCNIVDKCSTAVYGCTDTVNLAKEDDERNVHQMHLHLEDPSIVMDPATSHSSELITKPENTCGEADYDSSKRLPQTSDGLEELNKYGNCDLEVPSVNKIAELQFEDSKDKDEVIKSLKEEVSRLNIITHTCHGLLILFCFRRTRISMLSLTHTSCLTYSCMLLCFQRTVSIYRMCYLNFSFVRLIVLK